MQPVHTLARSLHLHIGDIVVDDSRKRMGVGRALMGYAETDAMARGMGAVYLDARSSAIRFYERNGYQLHRTPSMTKQLSDRTGATV
jgi:ribosomal protein S18 acetylase RimI-like enzyme